MSENLSHSDWKHLEEHVIHFTPYVLFAHSEIIQFSFTMLWIVISSPCIYYLNEILYVPSVQLSDLYPASHLYKQSPNLENLSHEEFRQCSGQVRHS